LLILDNNELTNVARDSARGGFYLFSGTALATIVLAVGSILIARILGPEVYGQYALVMTVPQLMYLFTELGINEGITKFTADMLRRGEEKRIEKLVKHGLLLRVSIGLLIFLINYVLADLIASFLLNRPELAFYLRIGATTILFQVIFTTAASTFVGLDKAEYSALTLNVQSVSKTLISLTLVVIGFTLTGAILGHVISYVISAFAGILLLTIILRRLKKSEDKNIPGLNLQLLVKYGTPLYISILLTGFIPFVQNLVLAFFTTDAQIGNFKAAINFATLMTTMAIPITTALLPAFSKLSSGGKNVVKDFFKIANKYTAALIVPAATLVILFSNQIVQIIYGSTYYSASAYLSLYCFLYFLVGIGYLTFASLYNGLGETKINLRISLITFVMMLSISIPLTQLHGVTGLILAFVVSSAAGQIYALYYAKKRFNVGFDKSALLKIYLISLISSIIPITILNFSNLPTALTASFGSIFYLVSYISLFPITRIITADELQKIKSIAQTVPLLWIIAKPVLLYQGKLLKFRLVFPKSNDSL
jgi:O-antigen/teichoic acid export membrane protein